MAIDDQEPQAQPTADPPSPVPDARLYVTDPADWMAHVKNDSSKAYCYQKNPGEDYFHLILSGEIYLQCGDEKLCLQCALRRGVVTTDRLFWQNRVRKVKAPPF